MLTARKNLPRLSIKIPDKTVGTDNSCSKKVVDSTNDETKTTPVKTDTPKNNVKTPTTNETGGIFSPSQSIVREELTNLTSSSPRLRSI